MALSVQRYFAPILRPVRPIFETNLISLKYQNNRNVLLLTRMAWANAYSFSNEIIIAINRYEVSFGPDLRFVYWLTKCNNTTSVSPRKWYPVLNITGKQVDHKVMANNNRRQNTFE